MRLSYLVFSLLFLFTAACSDRKYIPERKLVKMLAEMHQTDALLEDVHLSSYTSWRPDSTSVYVAILDRYGYTTEQLYNSLSRYGSSADKATTLYGKVCERLEKQQRRAHSKVEALHKRQDRWKGKSAWTLPNDGDTSRLPFSIPVVGLGEYILEANIALYSADSVSRPRMTMYLYSAASDSTLLLVEQEVQRSEVGKDYSLAIANRNAAATHVRGYVFDRDNDSLGSRPRYAAAKNIMLRFLPSGDDGQNSPPSQSYMSADIPADTSPPVRVSVIDARRPLPPCGNFEF
ncbi:MAG: DUF4296 domain-containing protein [Prevotellaceae bacterium]|jgi:hypothetical protein|nr:DUF4296 domain-containing protein [Prevotellaceae bacterium]